MTPQPEPTFINIYLKEVLAPKDIIDNLSTLIMSLSADSSESEKQQICDFYIFSAIREYNRKLKDHDPAFTKADNGEFQDDLRRIYYFNFRKNIDLSGAADEPDVKPAEEQSPAEVRSKKNN